MWDRPNIEFVQSQDLPWHLVPDGEFGAGGGLRKTLSTDATAGAVSALVQTRYPQRGVLVAGADLYVLAGEGRVNGRDFAAGHYLSVPPGARVDLIPDGPTTVFLGTFGPPALTDAEAGDESLQHVDVEELPWSSTAPDAAVKWLRRDAGGIVFLSAKLPGWKSTMEEVHPHHEESFRIAGDFWIGAPGVMTAGSYFYHRPGFWHGPLYSRGGTTSLIRADSEIRTEHREPRTVGHSGRAYATLAHPALSRLT